MVSGGTARDQLQRILYLLQAAAGDGAEIGALAEALGVSPDVVIGDLDEVAARAYYHRAGPADQLNVFIEPDRVRVSTTGDFRRPTALDPREALTLSLGIRVLAGDRDEAGRRGLLDLAERLETDLASVPIDDFQPSYAIEGDADREADAIRGALSDAVDARRVVTFRYLKADAGAAARADPDTDETRALDTRAPENRELEPYALVGSMGRWYAIGYDRGREDVRVFRVDRILDLEAGEEIFDVPEDFELDDYLAGGHVYRALGDVRATVRYDASIARWILERGDGVEGPDGAAVVEHPVADAGWVVRHVLRYGGRAELVGPPELRAKVAAAARAIVEAHGD